MQRFVPPPASFLSPLLSLQPNGPKQQVGADVSGKLVSPDVGPQTEKTLSNLAAILEVAGSSLGRALKVNIYVSDQVDYAGMNEVYMRVS